MPDRCVAMCGGESCVTEDTPQNAAKSKVTFLGAKVYVRFRVCDDQPRNLGILVRETRPGVRPALRRFATRVPPRPCGAYTRSWLPAQRFRGPGRYTITLRARDASGRTSLPAQRTFRR